MGHIINDKEFYTNALKYGKLIDWKSPFRRHLSKSAFRPPKYNSKAFIDSCPIWGAPADTIQNIKPRRLCGVTHSIFNQRSNLVLGWKRTPAH